MSCGTPAISDVRLTVSAWQFGTYAVRLTAYSLSRPFNGSRWLLQLDAYPEALPQGFCETGAASVRGFAEVAR